MLEAEATEKTPGMLLHVLHRACANAIQTELNDQGLSDVGSPMILFILSHRGNGGEIASQRDLAAELRVSPATIATSLKSLERLGYVERRADRTDARRNRIAITDKGIEAVNSCFKAFERVDARMMQGFTPQEMRDLDRLHRKILKNLGGETLPQKGDCCSCSEN